MASLVTTGLVSVGGGGIWGVRVPDFEGGLEMFVGGLEGFDFLVGDFEWVLVGEFVRGGAEYVLLGDRNSPQY